MILGCYLDAFSVHLTYFSSYIMTVVEFVVVDVLIRMSYRIAINKRPVWDKDQMLSINGLIYVYTVVKRS